MNEKETCENCKYFCIGNIHEGTINKQEYPHCRRYAPRILCGVGGGYSSQLFPMIDEKTWRGEWSEK